jgi:hypothetical protein
MLFLHSHGVSTSRAVRIFKTYGEQAIEKVRSNPKASRTSSRIELRRTIQGLAKRRCVLPRNRLIVEHREKRVPYHNCLPRTLRA